MSKVFFQRLLRKLKRWKSKTVVRINNRRRSTELNFLGYRMAVDTTTFYLARVGGHT